MYFADKEFLIYVAENINGEHAKFLHQTRKLYHFLFTRRVKRWYEIGIKYEAEDQKALAKNVPVQWSWWVGALKAAAFTTWTATSLPVNERPLVCPTIVNRTKQFGGLTGEQQNKIYYWLSVMLLKVLYGSVRKRSNARLPKRRDRNFEGWSLLSTCAASQRRPAARRVDQHRRSVAAVPNRRRNSLQRADADVCFTCAWNLRLSKPARLQNWSSIIDL